jgi:hypothetical protein
MKANVHNACTWSMKNAIFFAINYFVKLDKKSTDMFLCKLQSNLEL